MVFRLPSNLENLIPPLAEQHPQQPPPWRGSFVVTGMRSSDQSSTQEIFVTAVETDGEKYVDFFIYKPPLVGGRMQNLIFNTHTKLLAGRSIGQPLFMFASFLNSRCCRMYRHGSGNASHLCLFVLSCPIVFENKMQTQSIRPTFVLYRASSSKIKRFVFF